MALNLRRLSIRLLIEGTLESGQDLSVAKDPLNLAYALNFTNGAGANQAHQWFHDTRTLGAGASENLDFAGALANAFTSALASARLKALIIIHKTPAASAAMSVGGHATAALNTIMTSVEGLDTDQPKLVVRPGGWLVLAAPDATGYVVTATTEDIVTVANGGAAGIDYDVFALVATS